jgi:hypothetical protein
MAIGLYGPEYLQFSNGGPAAEVRIFVFLPGTKTKAQLFADHTGAYSGPNPVWTDRRGELVFFAEEGSYDLYYEYPGESGVTIPVEVPASPQVNPDVYVHNQSTASLSWMIVHNMGTKPTVIVEESVLFPDDVTIPAIRYLDDNTTELRWGYAASGRATLRR